MPRSKPRERPQRWPRLSARGISSIGAQDATPAAGSEEVVQTFYQRGYTINPTSFDFNANLYCNGDTNAFEGVLTFDADLNPAPGWAETWESNEDASVWTFHIRPNNTGWSDGNPVTAQRLRLFLGTTAPCRRRLRRTRASSSTSRMPKHSTPAPRASRRRISG